MNDNNSNVIISLCSHLCVGEGVFPLEPSEWVDVSRKLIMHKKQPQDINNFTDKDYQDILIFDSEKSDRIKRLLNRAGSIAFEIEKLANVGIKLVTRSELEYPTTLKKKLGQSCPPIFYYAGDLSILQDEFIGIVGSRSIDNNDFEFAKKMASKAVQERFSIVSGGAKGVDTIASQTAISSGGVAVEFLADSLIKKMKDAQIVKSIRDGRLLLISASKPDAGFNVGLAMQRNKYIYAQSMGTIVVKSDFNKGGTWGGATENLRHQWCHTFCWNNNMYKGNQELIAKGAIGIGTDFNPNEVRKQIDKKVTTKQQTLFDFIEDENNL